MTAGMGPCNQSQSDTHPGSGVRVTSDSPAVARLDPRRDHLAQELDPLGLGVRARAALHVGQDVRRALPHVRREHLLDALLLQQLCVCVCVCFGGKYDEVSKNKKRERRLETSVVFYFLDFPT